MNLTMHHEGKTLQGISFELTPYHDVATLLKNMNGRDMIMRVDRKMLRLHKKECSDRNCVRMRWYTLQNKSAKPSPQVPPETSGLRLHPQRLIHPHEDGVLLHPISVRLGQLLDVRPPIVARYNHFLSKHPSFR